MSLARRGWAFVLDGHVFYVLPIHDRTLVLDLTTGQWHQWGTRGFPIWNAYRGVVWRGKTLAADEALPAIWCVDPSTALDEEAHPIERVTSGFTPFRGRSAQPVGKVLLTASVGDPSIPDAEVRLRFSDDEGETWSRYFSVPLEGGNFAQVIAFRSLGRVRAPGRLWEISDAGGMVTIEGMHANIGEG